MTIEELIAFALEEDIPSGDLTSDLVGPLDANGKARLIAKEDIVLSGSKIFEKVFHAVDPDIRLEWFFKNSELVMQRQTVCTIKGKYSSLLKAERVALNFLGHLSGIASLTKCFVEETKGTDCKILDTRKTTPLLRQLEKQAVVDGGGVNHRLNLSDAILIKENHIEAVGGIDKAIKKAKEKSQLPIQIEVKNFEEAKLAVECKADKLLLDNMSTEEIQKVADQFAKNVSLEASGNMSVERIKEVARTGVHFISVGAITHSAPSADFSLLIE